MTDFVRRYIESRLGSSNRQEGTVLAEYALLAVLIAVVCCAAVTLLGASVRSQLFEVAAGI